MKVKLNLGCGNTHLQGYVNCDKSKEVNPDKVVDLERKLPFKDNSIDEVIGNHILEHVFHFIPLMHELHRICKEGAILKFVVPFYASMGAFDDPTHVRFFSPFTFNYFTNNEFSYEMGARKGLFKIKKVELNYGIGTAKKLNFLINPLLNLSHRFYCKVFAWILPAAEIKFELEVVK